VNPASILSQQYTPGSGLQSLSSSVKAASDTSSSSSSTTSTSSADTITMNDFLTLLVTELKNQDPTADNDPNAYVNQLVAINSLEQLININATVSSDLSDIVSSTSSTSSAATASNSGQFSAYQTAASGSTAALSGTTAASSLGTAATGTASQSNLTSSPISASAQRIANALGGQ